MPKKMGVSCIICHHQGHLLRHAVNSFLVTEGVNIEIIVVSSVLTEDFYGCKVFHLPGQPAAKRNLGARHAKYDYIAYFDDDVEVRPDTVAEMLKVCQRDGVGMVFGKLLNFEHQDMFDEAGGFMTWTGFIWARGDRQKDLGQFEKVGPIFAGKSAACMVRKQLMKEIQGFDESFGILGEESDLAWRVWRSGHSVFYAPSSVTLHKFNTKFKPRSYYSDQRVYYNGPRNYLAMLLKNAPWSLLVSAIPIQLLAWSLAALGHLFSGRPRASALILAGLASSLLRFVSLIRQGSGTPRLLPPLKYIPLSYYFNRLRNYIKQGLHG